MEPQVSSAKLATKWLVPLMVAVVDLFRYSQRWLGTRVMGLFFTPKSENECYARQSRNSAGIAVFLSDVSDKSKVAFERTMLRKIDREILVAGWKHPAVDRALDAGFNHLKIGRGMGDDPLRATRRRD